MRISRCIAKEFCSVATGISCGDCQVVIGQIRRDGRTLADFDGKFACRRAYSDPQLVLSIDNRGCRFRPGRPLQGYEADRSIGDWSALKLDGTLHSYALWTGIAAARHGRQGQNEHAPRNDTPNRAVDGSQLWCARSQIRSRAISRRQRPRSATIPGIQRCPSIVEDDGFFAGTGGQAIQCGCIDVFVNKSHRPVSECKVSSAGMVAAEGL